MKRIIPQTNNVAPSSPAVAPPPDAAAGVFDIDALLAKAGEIVRREIMNLMSESSGKKLSPASARDLVAYVKLLSEIKMERDKALSDMSDEELKKIVDTQSKP